MTTNTVMVGSYSVKNMFMYPTGGRLTDHQLESDMDLKWSGKEVV